MQLLRHLNENHHQIRLLKMKKNVRIQGGKIKLIDLIDNLFLYIDLLMMIMIPIENMPKERQENE